MVCEKIIYQFAIFWIGRPKDVDLQIFEKMESLGKTRKVLVGILERERERERERDIEKLGRRDKGRERKKEGEKQRKRNIFYLVVTLTRMFFQLSHTNI